MSQRNTSISIAKGIAIILMVVGHAECPGALMSLIYLFHMPLFFITAGYFFTRAHADEPWQFVHALCQMEHLLSTHPQLDVLVGNPQRNIRQLVGRRNSSLHLPTGAATRSKHRIFDG